MVNIVARQYPHDIAQQLMDEGLPPVLARVFAARGIKQRQQLEYSLENLLPPDNLRNIASMAQQLADAIQAGKRLLVVADYDSDGATACAVAVRGLRACGAVVDFLVPNRFEYGYGLTPEIVRFAKTMQPDIIVTVDNGIASVDGVREANQLGMQVLVTDHHLPGDALPEAACIVNPNQHGCAFPSKNLAGVGVMFYVLLALRAELRQRRVFAASKEPNLANLLDLVALGTVADVVKLDDNNRVLVEHGLRRIRAGKASPGIMALLRVAGRDFSRASAFDLGFAVGPRLNAAGRLDDMSLGINCLLASNFDEAMLIAQQLDELNRERRNIEADMHDTALASLDDIDVGEQYSISLFDADWHQGVIGILASRLKEKYHRPVIVFAPSADGDLRGSGRSIHGLHLRDALDLVSKRHDGLLKRFGGHAMAAGMTIAEANFSTFRQVFEEVVRELLTPADLQAVFETDGELSVTELGMELASVLDSQVWGQGFPAPAFHGTFATLRQRVVGERHLKLTLGQAGREFDAILFNHAEELPQQIHAAYQLQVNHFNGTQTTQLTIKHWLSA